MRKYAHIPNRDGNPKGNPQTKQDMWDDFVIVALLIVKEKQRDENVDRRKQFEKLAFRKVQM